MAAMPRGEPRTVPDPAGELYDREMAKVRAERAAIEGVSRQRWVGSPARMEAQDAMTAVPPMSMTAERSQNRYDGMAKNYE